jgi:NADH dehydrogenase
VKANIPVSNQKRVVIIGGGFAGLRLARKLLKYDLQIVLVDKNNYHQFQPLFYQVATAGLEPSSISFPFRKIFQKNKNIYFRLAEVESIESDRFCINSTIGEISYDYLVIAIGANTNFFNNPGIADHAMPMKSVPEALEIRNKILQNYEDALSVDNEEDRNALMNIVVVGGGPTGVEVSGSLAELKKNILPKDYPELDSNKIQIFLFEASQKLLNGMSEQASQKANEYLRKLGVKVNVGIGVKSYDGSKVSFTDDSFIQSKTLIWAAGVTGNKIKGIPADVLVRGNRIKVNRFNQVEGCSAIFAIGDIAYMTEEKYPNGHPQVAQVAIQQANYLAFNFTNIFTKRTLKEFCYKDLGSMATIGRNLAVVDFPLVKFHGLFAWFVWMFVHLMAIVGIKNRILVFINWTWNYITYDQSLRLIIKHKNKRTGL